MRGQNQSSGANAYAQKNMRFINRYLIFRYMTAIFFFFFINLYWALFSLANWTVMRSGTGVLAFGRWRHHL